MGTKNDFKKSHLLLSRWRRVASRLCVAAAASSWSFFRICVEEIEYYDDDASSASENPVIEQRSNFKSVRDEKNNG